MQSLGGQVDAEPNSLLPAPSAQPFCERNVAVAVSGLPLVLLHCACRQILERASIEGQIQD